MRRTMMLLATIGALAFVVAVGPAEAAEHPGCKGLTQAAGKANAKAQPALAKAAERLGCGTTTPEPPADPVACAEGQTSIARYTYTGSKNGPEDAYGYATWVGSWTTVLASDDVRIDGLGDASTNGDGFYWSETTTGTVSSIVVQNVNDDVLTFDAPFGSYLINNNSFVVREGGIEHVNFCTSASSA